jgi:hypothetical protein
MRMCASRKGVKDFFDLSSGFTRLRRGLPAIFVADLSAIPLDGLTLTEWLFAFLPVFTKNLMLKIAVMILQLAPFMGKWH